MLTSYYMIVKQEFQFWLNNFKMLVVSALRAETRGEWYICPPGKKYFCCTVFTLMAETCQPCIWPIYINVWTLSCVIVQNCALGGYTVQTRKCASSAKLSARWHYDNTTSSPHRFRSLVIPLLVLMCSIYIYGSLENLCVQESGTSSNFIKKSWI